MFNTGYNKNDAYKQGSGIAPGAYLTPLNNGLWIETEGRNVLNGNNIVMYETFTTTHEINAAGLVLFCINGGTTTVKTRFFARTDVNAGAILCSNDVGVLANTSNQTVIIPFSSSYTFSRNQTFVNAMSFSNGGSSTFLGTTDAYNQGSAVLKNWTDVANLTDVIINAGAAWPLNSSNYRLRAYLYAAT